MFPTILSAMYRLAIFTFDFLREADASDLTELTKFLSIHLISMMAMVTALGIVARIVQRSQRSEVRDQRLEISQNLELTSFSKELQATPLDLNL